MRLIIKNKNIIQKEFKGTSFMFYLLNYLVYNIYLKKAIFKIALYECINEFKKFDFFIIFPNQNFTSKARLLRINYL